MLNSLLRSDGEAQIRIPFAAIIEELKAACKCEAEYAERKAKK